MIYEQEKKKRVWILFYDNWMIRNLTKKNDFLQLIQLLVVHDRSTLDGIGEMTWNRKICAVAEKAEMTR